MLSFMKKKFHVLLLRISTPLLLAVCAMDALGAEAGKAEFFTLYYKAYCDKCVNGFKSETKEGFNVWLEEIGLGDDTHPAIVDLVNRMKDQDCEILAKDRSLSEFSCDDLVAKYRLYLTDPDPIYSSSESTWRYFIESLSEGNKEKALSCFHYSSMSKYQALINSLTNADMKEMAKNMKDIGLGKIIDNFQEGMVKSGDKASIVVFVYQRGEWKISQL
jgi:hypothetical protein